jgi:hypothetical protein
VNNRLLKKKRLQLLGYVFAAEIALIGILDTFSLFIFLIFDVQM